MDDVSIMDCLEGGDDGGVSSPREGAGPVGHTGICLLGTAAGVPLDEVFKERCGGGVGDLPKMGGALATTAAMCADECYNRQFLRAKQERIDRTIEGTQRGTHGLR